MAGFPDQPERHHDRCRCAHRHRGGIRRLHPGISNADLLAGRFRFEATPDSANVVNRGTIVTQSGGFVYFVGRNVENSGVIHTPRGEILLAAGNAVEIINPAVAQPGRVEISAGANEAVNLGKLVAAGGTIGMFAGTVRQRGMASASTAEVDASRTHRVPREKGRRGGGGSRTEVGSRGGSVQVIAETVWRRRSGSIEARGTRTPVLEAAPPRLPFCRPCRGGAHLVTHPDEERAGVVLRAAPRRANDPLPRRLRRSPRHARWRQRGRFGAAGGPVRQRRHRCVGRAGAAVRSWSAATIAAPTLLVRNPNPPVVEADVVIRADAQLRGNGGKVCRWAG